MNLVSLLSHVDKAPMYSVYILAYTIFKLISNNRFKTLSGKTENDKNIRVREEGNAGDT